MSSGRNPASARSPPPSARGGDRRPVLAASDPPSAAPSSPTSAVVPPIATSTSITGSDATSDALLFVEAFLPLALKTDRARSLRKVEWKSHLDTGGNRRVSLGAAEGWIQRTLRNAPCVKNAATQPKGGSGGRAGTAGAAKATALFKRYKPSYIHAYNATIAHSATGSSSSHHTASAADDATVGSAASSSHYGDHYPPRQHDHHFVSQKEFRLLVSNVCFHALAYDAFAIVDLDGTSRITREEFVTRIGKVRDHGFEMLRLIGSGDGVGSNDDESAYWEPHAVFDRMDADKGGMVLFGEWASFLKVAELECAMQHQLQQQRAIAANGGDEGAGEQATAAPLGRGAFWGELLAVSSDLGATSATHTTAGMTSAGDSESDGVSVSSGFSLSSMPSLGTRSVASTPRSPSALRSTPKKTTPRTHSTRGSVGLSRPSERNTGIPPPRFSPTAQSTSAKKSNTSRPQSALDASTLASEIDSLKLQLQSAQDELAAAKAELANAQGEADDLRNALRDAHVSHTERVSMLEFQSDEGLLKHREEVERLEAQVRTKTEECEELAHRLEHESRMLEECRALHEGSEREVKSVQVKLEECRTERDELNGKLNTETVERRAEVEGLRTELDEARQQRDEADKASSSRIDALQVELAEAKQARDKEVETLQAELSDARESAESRIDALQEELSDARSAGEAKDAEVGSLREELDAAMEAAKEHQSELARTTGKLEEAQGELELMTERCKHLDEKLTKKLHVTNDELLQSKQKAERLQQQLDTKVTALQTEAAMAQSEAKRASKEIESERKARAEAEDQNRKLAVDVDVLQADLGTAKAAKAKLKQAETELRSSTEEINNLKVEVTKARAAVKARDAEVASFQESIRKFKSDQGAHQAAVAQNQRETEQLHAQIDSLCRERDNALDEARRMALHYSDQCDELQRVMQKICGLEAQNERLSASSDKLTAVERETRARGQDGTERRDAAESDLLESMPHGTASVERQRVGETEEEEGESSDGPAKVAPMATEEEKLQTEVRTRIAGNEGTRENGNGGDGTRRESRSLDFGDDGEMAHKKKGNCLSVFMLCIFGLIFAAACTFFFCSRCVLCPSTDGNRFDEDLPADDCTIEPEPTTTIVETCPSTDNFTAAISTLESTLRQREAEYKKKAHECELELRRKEADYETKSLECERDFTKLADESKSLRSSHQACSAEIEAHRVGAKECLEQLDVLKDANKSMELSLFALLLSLNDCEMKLEANNCTAAISALESTLSEKEVEYETVTGECELDKILLSTESDTLRSSYRVCEEEIEDCRGGAKECRNQLKVLEDEKDGAQGRLSAARLSLNECDVKLGAEKMFALTIQTKYDQLASRCDEDVENSKRELEAIAEAKRVAERLLELCEDSSRSKDAASTEMQAWYEQLLQESNPLAGDEEGSEQRPKGDGADLDNARRDEVSAPRQKLGSNFKVLRNKMNAKLRDANIKRQARKGGNIDWIDILNTLGVLAY